MLQTVKKSNGNFSSYVCIYACRPKKTPYYKFSKYFEIVFKNQMDDFLVKNFEIWIFGPHQMVFGVS